LVDRMHINNLEIKLRIANAENAQDQLTGGQSA
jgi:hypothetical protein